MRKIGILVISAILALVLFNCEKPEDEIDSVNEPDKVAINRERISFLKSSNTSVEDYKNQQGFTLHYTNLINDTTIGFVVEYLAGDKYILHEFDFVWDEKLVADEDGKIWMNLDIYHKTEEENANNTLFDSTMINIPILLTFSDETTSNLWLKFNNTSKNDNLLTLQYKKGTNNNEDTTETETDGAAQDSTGTETSGTVQDSTVTENGGTTETETDGTVQDSTSTETGGTVQDSTGYETGGTTETETGGTVQDSTGYENGGTTGTETGGTAQDSTGYENGGTVQDSTTYSGN